jgi:hypothetical protein
VKPDRFASPKPKYVNHLPLRVFSSAAYPYANAPGGPGIGEAADKVFLRGQRQLLVKNTDLGP